MTKKPSIYLDYAAATPVDTAVTRAMAPFATELFANPSASYSAARETRAALDDARTRVAKCLGARSHEIIFTAGATESLNLAIFGSAKPLPGSRVIVSAIEHEAILACADALAGDGYDTQLCPVDEHGVVKTEALERLINDETSLVSIMLANNEIGTIQPISQVAGLIADVRADRAKRQITQPIYLHTDASAAAGSLDLHPSRLGVDLMTINGGKIYGPKQSGCLYARAGIKLAPLIYGGGQERGLRGGTESVAAAVGLATALEIAQKDRQAENQRLERLRDEAWQSLKMTFPDTILNGHPRRRLVSNLNFTIPGVDGEMLVLYLDQAGILTATGSACAAANTEPSHVLLAIGCTSAEASSSLRLSLGRATTKADLDQLLVVLPPIVQRLRELGREASRKPLQ